MLETLSKQSRDPRLDDLHCSGPLTLSPSADSQEFLSARAGQLSSMLSFPTQALGRRKCLPHDLPGDILDDFLGDLLGEPGFRQSLGGLHRSVPKQVSTVSAPSLPKAPFFVDKVPSHWDA